MQFKRSLAVVVCSLITAISMAYPPPDGKGGGKGGGGDNGGGGDPPTVSYSIELLPNFGGGRSQAEGMNSHGDVVGSARTGVLGTHGWNHAFLYDFETRTMTDLHDQFVAEGLLDDLPYGPIDYEADTGWTVVGASSINDSGQIVAICTLREEVGTTASLTVRYTPASETTASYWEEIDPFVEGARVTAVAINNAGLVVGYTEGADGLLHAFEWSHPADGTQDLGVLNGRSMYVQDVNDSGELCGYTPRQGTTDARSWRLDAGGYLSLGKLQKGKWGDSYAYAINELGEVTGTSDLESGVERAFLYNDANGMKGLGTLGGTSSWGACLNDNTDVAGLSHLPGDTEVHVFLYTSGAMIDVEASISGFSESPYSGFLRPFGMTNSGVIFGTTDRGNGLEHQAFLLIPN